MLSKTLPDDLHRDRIAAFEALVAAGAKKHTSAKAGERDKDHQLNSVRQPLASCDETNRLLRREPDGPEHHREPGRPSMLEQAIAQYAEELAVLDIARLVAVFEQTRDIGKAAPFLRAYRKAVPDDPWVAAKAEHFRALGLA